MKSYTDLEQSKRLAEILPLVSADMYYSPLGGTHPWVLENDLIEKDAVPCWSLAMLLEIIANVAAHIDEDGYLDAVICQDVHSVCLVNCNGELCKADNLIDACVEMILKLHELKLL